MSIPEQVNGEPVLAFMSGDGKGYAVTFRASDGFIPSTRSQRTGSASSPGAGAIGSRCSARRISPR